MEMSNQTDAPPDSSVEK